MDTFQSRCAGRMQVLQLQPAAAAQPKSRHRPRQNHSSRYTVLLADKVLLESRCSHLRRRDERRNARVPAARPARKGHRAAQAVNHVALRLAVRRRCRSRIPSVQGNVGNAAGEALLRRGGAGMRQNAEGARRGAQPLQLGQRRRVRRHALLQMFRGSFIECCGKSS